MKKNKWAKIAVGVIAAVVAFGAILAISRNNDDEKVLNGWAYQTCMLDDASGKKDVDDKSGISTKDFYELEQLQLIKWSPDEVDVCINIYDEDKMIMSADWFTDGQYSETDAASAMETGGVYFKLEIEDLDDDNISFFEKFGLADKVEVTFKK